MSNASTGNISLILEAQTHSYCMPHFMLEKGEITMFSFIYVANKKYNCITVDFPSKIDAVVSKHHTSDIE